MGKDFLFYATITRRYSNPPPPLLIFMIDYNRKFYAD